MAHAYSRPAEGTVTRTVWDIAADESRRRGRLADRKSVIDLATAQGINYNTASTQYFHWRRHEEAELAGPAAPGDAPLAFRLELKEAGRLLLPAELRAAMGVAEGQVLMGQLVDGELRLMTRDTAVRKAQALVRQHVPAGVSLVDELIADRRTETRRDEVDG